MGTDFVDLGRFPIPQASSKWKNAIENLGNIADFGTRQTPPVANVVGQKGASVSIRAAGNITRSNTVGGKGGSGIRDIASIEIGTLFTMKGCRNKLIDDDIKLISAILMNRRGF